jgi:orotate phosphoribosyltransferase
MKELPDWRDAEGLRRTLHALLRTHSFREGDFVLASGRRSSFYVDVRRTALTAEGAWCIGHLMAGVLERETPVLEGVGGMTLGADPLVTATSLAFAMRGRSVDGFLARKEPKGHGTGQQVESAGTLRAGSRVVVLDDSMTSGGSTLRAVEAARNAGYEVLATACVVDRCEGARERLGSEGLPLWSLFTVDELRMVTPA